MEFERYELNESPFYRFKVDRREFLARTGGGLVILVALGRTEAYQESGGGRRRRSSPPVPQEIGAWLQIGADGSITAYSGKAEVGQNVRTSLAQAVAEELEIPFASVAVVLGDTELTPYDAGTFGSRSTPVMIPQLRKAAAAAREKLIDIAADQWGVERGDVRASGGRVVCEQKQRTTSYGELTRGKKLLEVISADVPLRPSSEWRVIGRSEAKTNARAIVTGKHQHTPDIRLPGMLYGKVLRPDKIGASLVSVDSSAAERMSGVTVVKDANFAGVAADRPDIASEALAALKPEWKQEALPDCADLFRVLKERAQSGSVVHSSGSMDQVQSDAVKLSRTYTVPYIAHAPLEPRAAVAHWTDNALTVWTGTQRPFGVRAELAQVFGLPEDRVRVIVPDTGSAYGGKHTGEAAVEAARLAKAAGRPVKLVWTREEEFAHAYFRPAGVIEISSAVTRAGELDAWECHNYNSGGSAIRPPYHIPHQQIVFHQAPSPLRQGSYRALAATANTFAREVHMDEVAAELRLDPLEFRLRNLQEPRLRGVLEAAAKAFTWGTRKANPRHGFGIAAGTEKGGYVANCVEVEVEADGTSRPIRIVTAFECGAIINPDHLKNQVEGAIIMGLGGALSEKIEWEQGRISTDRFSKYKVPRFKDMPALETVLLGRPDLPTAGAGECPIIAIAPALANAIWQATGTRHRSLPLNGSTS